MGGVRYLETPCRSALNEVRARFPFRWSLNPYNACAHRCAFCYARAYARRADRPSDDRYGRVIGVKTNIAETLAGELARASWRNESIAIGTATDPYQPAEGRYRLTRFCLERLIAASNPFSITTRGPLIVRDLDLLVEASRRAAVSVAFSVPTLDDEIWRATEPGTPPPRQRLRALAMLVEAGVRAGVFMAPVLPGLSDRPELLEEVVAAARRAGATFVWLEMLNLKPGCREHFLAVLAESFPEQLPLYQRLYARHTYLTACEGAPTRARLDELRRRHGIADRRTARLAPPSPARQLRLAL
ncbi:MAG: radical SAM protein [Gaiellaceae bacterium]|jgi:DNA repair photolyase